MDKKIISDFANIVGNIEIVLNLDSFDSVKSQYKEVLTELLKWVKYYYENKNLDIVTHEDSLKLHTILDDLRWKVLPDKNTGNESLLSDDILIRYEAIMKKINNERGNV